MIKDEISHVIDVLVKAPRTLPFTLFGISATLGLIQCVIDAFNADYYHSLHMLVDSMVIIFMLYYWAMWVDVKDKPRFSYRSSRDGVIMFVDQYGREYTMKQELK